MALIVDGIVIVGLVKYMDHCTELYLYGSSVASRRDKPYSSGSLGGRTNGAGRNCGVYYRLRTVLCVVVCCAGFTVCCTRSLFRANARAVICVFEISGFPATL